MLKIRITFRGSHALVSRPYQAQTGKVRPRKPPAPRLSVLSSHPPVRKAPPRRIDAIRRTSVSSLHVYSPWTGNSASSWAPIRSTKGVSQLVSFGLEPAKVADSLVEALRVQEASIQVLPERLFKPGERVRLTEAPFAGIEGIYQMAEGERRVMVLIELLSKQVRLQVAPANLRRVG